MTGFAKLSRAIGKILDCVTYASLGKRSGFVAGDDSRWNHGAGGEGECNGNGGGDRSGGGGLRQAPALRPAIIQ